MKKCYNPPAKKRTFKRNVTSPKSTPLHSDFEDSDSETSNMVVPSRALPLSSERVQDEAVDDRDVTTDKKIELGDTVYDPTWRPFR